LEIHVAQGQHGTITFCHAFQFGYRHVFIVGRIGLEK
jgi:hypothetical protein